MNVLVINCGSSSLKYQLINSDSEEVLAKGLCERIGIDGRLVYQPTGGEKETPILVSNVVNMRKFEIKTPDVVIQVKPDRADLIETRMLDGRPYFVIPADDSVEVNGIPIRTQVPVESDEDISE